MVLYLALALWVTYGLWRNTGALALVFGGSDVHFFEWTLIHATRIFTHGENPFFTPQLNAPDGVNLMANTGLLGLTVPLVPVTLLFGPAVAFTVMLTGGLTATAWAWYHVLSRHIVGFWPAALVGGLFAGFAPGIINHVNGHPDLVSQFLIPFIIWRAISLRTARDGVVLGLLVTWQAFLNEELLFQTGLAVAVFVAAYAVFRPAEVRARVRPFLAGLWPALLTAGVLLAYPLWFQFFGPQSYRGLPDIVLGYGTDLRAFAAFSQSSLVRHGASHSSYGAPAGGEHVLRRPAAHRRRGDRGLAVAAAGGGTGADRRRARLLPAVPGPDRRGRRPYRAPPRPDEPAGQPAAVRQRGTHPVRPGADPGRGDPARVLGPRRGDRIRGRLRYGWTLVLAAALLPIAPTPVPVQRAVPVPAFFTSGQWRQYVHDDQSVLSGDPSVWNGSFTAMDWDDATGQEYRMVGGYFLGPDKQGKGAYGAPIRPTVELLTAIVYYGGNQPDHRCAAGRLPGRPAVLAHRDRGAQPGRPAP